MALQDQEGFSSAMENEGDKQLLVRFSIRPRKDELASVEAGRPIYRDTEYVEIKSPDDTFSIPSKVVDDGLRARFAVQYNRWKLADKAAKESGTPLSEWPGITRSQVEELRHYHVGTVEQLAEKTDLQLRDIPDLLALRQRARDFLAKAQDSSVVDQMRASIQEKEMQVQAMETRLKQQAEAMAELKKQQKARAAQ